MANHKLLVPILLKWEGGYVDDPLDRGGATNKGVTIGALTRYRKSIGLPPATKQDVRNLSDEVWGEIMKYNYWDRWLADEIKNQSIANILVDWVWGSGVHGIKIPQRLLGVSDDGVVGGKTIAALNSANQRELFDKIKTARLAFVDRIVANNPSQKRFIKGWKNRINEFKFEDR